MSRFYRRPIASLPPRRRSFRRRRSRWRIVVWLLVFAGIAAGFWWLMPRNLGLKRAEPADTGNSEKSESPNVTALVPITGKAAEKPHDAEKPSTQPDFDKNFRPRLPQDVFEAQIALTRDAIDPGSIDGAWGGQTRAAVIAFQLKHFLDQTGQLDNTTRAVLELEQPPLTTYTVKPEDFLRLRPLPKGWLEKSALDHLDYSSVLELVAEQHWTNPRQIRRLNPDVDWDNITAGTDVVVPRVYRQPPATLPKRIVIRLEAKTLEVFDADNRLLAHFPCSIARRVEKRPVGDLEVETAAADPNYTFNPETFPDSPAAQSVGRKLILQPGPNNPVGVAWIGLNRPGYGIHGSPEPEQIGRTSSSGCFRLANWNARYLLPLVYPGMTVSVVP